MARNLSRKLEFGRHCARAIGRQRLAGRCSADACWASAYAGASWGPLKSGQRESAPCRRRRQRHNSKRYRRACWRHRHGKRAGRGAGGVATLKRIVGAAVMVRESFLPGRCGLRNGGAGLGCVTRFFAIAHVMMDAGVMGAAMMSDDRPLLRGCCVRSHDKAGRSAKQDRRRKNRLHIFPKPPHDAPFGGKLT